ncbi:hypothetical protein VPH35_088559 [Triticum aestivum]
MRTNETFLASPRSAPLVLPGRNKSQYKRKNDYHHIAGWSTTLSSYDARVKIGIWGSQGQRHSQESEASMYIYNSDQDESSINLIQAGFHVLPNLYKNNDVHFFIRWTTTTNQCAVIILECPSFVPASGAALVPGQAVAPPSTYDRDDRYITISLHTLCPKLYGIAPGVGWIGFVYYQDRDQGGPAMGSGHFPKEGQRKEAYFKNIKLFDSKANVYDPSALARIVSAPRCYKVSEVLHARKDGYMFYYGGPAGCMG